MLMLSAVAARLHGPEPNATAARRSTPKPVKGTAVLEPPLVFLLAGQSNMLGYGFTSELTQDELERIDAVADRVEVETTAAICENQQNKDDERLVPSRRNLSAVAAHGQRFGPELFFGLHMAEATGRRIVMVKRTQPGATLAYSWTADFDNVRRQMPMGVPNNCSIGGWETTEASLYRALLADLASTQQRLWNESGGQGVYNRYSRPSVLSGMLWLQGEADAHYGETSSAYQANLQAFVAALRNDCDAPSLPFVAAAPADMSRGGYDPDGQHERRLEEIRSAGNAYADSDAHAAFLQRVPDVQSPLFLPEFRERIAYQEDRVCGVQAACDFNQEHESRGEPLIDVRTMSQHYDTVAQRRLGRRYAYAIIGLQGGFPWLQSVRGVEAGGYTRDEQLKELVYPPDFDPMTSGEALYCLREICEAEKQEQAWQRDLQPRQEQDQLELQKEEQLLERKQLQQKQQTHEQQHKEEREHQDERRRQRKQRQQRLQQLHPPQPQPPPAEVLTPVREPGS